jgi:hypothetical protein
MASRMVTATNTPTITEVIRTEYIPIFFNNNNISISNASSLATTSDSANEVIFGPGALRFILSPFDNILRLKVYTNTDSTTNSSLVPLDLNTTAPKYKLSFETTTGKVEVLNSNDANQENLSTGLISFTVSKQDSESILKSNNRTVYLVSVSQDGTETLIYSGEWRKTTEQSDVDAAITAAKTKANSNSNIQTSLDNIAALMTSGGSKASIQLAADLTQIKSKAVTSTVNRFGVANAKSIQATIASVGTSGTSGKAN